MRTTTIIISFLFLVFFQTKSFSQFNGAYTYYYNYVSNIANSSEIAESAASDASNNLYVAGERSKETNSQEIHIIKYLTTGAVSASINHTDSLYREYVKKVLISGKSVYIVCNAVNISTNKSALLVLKYTTGLSFSSSFLFTAYSSPTDATLDDSGHIFISCYKITNKSSELEVLKLSSTLVTLHTYEYHYSGTKNTYTENPLSIYYNTIDKSVYAAGNVTSAANLSAMLLLKLNSVTDVLVWSKVSVFSPRFNSYNSVRTNATKVYAAGAVTDSLNVTHMQIDAYSYSGASPISYSYYDNINKGVKFKSTMALKITLAQSFDIYVVSIAKDSINQRCDIILSSLAPDFHTNSNEKVSMPYNTTISDAVTNQQSLYSLVTGCKAVGANQNMFTYGYQYGSGVIDYRDSIINRSACGNRIVYSNVNQAWVTGYLDTKSSIFVPHDYEYFTRRYVDTGIIGFTSIPVYPDSIIKKGINNGQITVSPNPSHDNLNITAKESIKDIQLYNEAGRLVLQAHLQTPNTFQYTLNIQRLSSGMYVLKVNNDKSFKVIKE